MRPILTLTAAALLATPALAQAQDHERLPESSTEELANTLRDPAMQAQMADTVAALSKVLIDLPVAPLAEAIAEAQGEPVEEIDPSLSVRDVAPGADELPDTIARELPQAMDRMGSMAGAFEKMLPALRDLAASFGDALEESRISNR